MLQQQLNKERHSRSPIRSHEVDLAAGAGGTVSMANIQAPDQSPLRERPAPETSSTIPAQIFTTKHGSNLSQDSGFGQGPRSRQASAGPADNASPLRQKSPARNISTMPVPERKSPSRMTMNERIGDLT